MSWITNARDTSLLANSGTLPDVSGAMLNWFQPMIFGLVTKTVEAFQVVETMVEIQFMGVWQPLDGRKLSIKPEGQRAWNSWMLHSDPSLNLKTDDVVVYLGRQYRVMAKKDYKLYGYNYYELISDWTGSGPEVITSMSINLRSNVSALGPSLPASFLGTGGVGPYVYSVLPNGAGGTINSSTGVYLSPAVLSEDPKKAYDTIQVIDSTSATATIQILVANHLLLFCDILKKQLNLDDTHLYIWDQKIFEPRDSSLYIAVGVINSRPFGNTNKFDGATNSSIQSINMLDVLSIDAISRGPAARDRKAEILLALNSDYAESQQELNSSRIGILPAGAQFINLSDVDGSAIPYRFRISINMQYFVKRVQTVSYYDEFSPVELTTEA